MKDFNDNEIIDFINFTKDLPISVRFIEFMPFDGNKWDMSKMVSYKEVMTYVNASFSEDQIERLTDAPNDTSKNYKIKGYQGSFAIISSVTNPFCDTCNRIRLTADGKIKNCLFAQTETDLLSAYRSGEDVKQLIENSIFRKAKERGGLPEFRDESAADAFSKNRSMISIGG